MGDDCLIGPVPVQQGLKKTLQRYYSNVNMSDWGIWTTAGQIGSGVTAGPAQALLIKAPALDRGMNDERSVKAKTINFIPRWPKAPLKFIYIFT